jgi:transforming growth factor-beta-induced protein
MTTRLLHYFLALALTAFVAGCDFGDDDDPPPPGNITKVAQQRGFTALLAATSKAGLADALADGSASLTVFAPTDAAFAQLAARLGFSDATAMVNALPASALGSILTYHVLPARRTAAELASGGSTQPTLYAFEGAPAALSLDTATGVQITDAALTTATVQAADVPASNGVIHAIDKVLIPPGVLTVVQMAQANPLFSTLVEAVVSANLQATLGGAGPFTVFAPTNDAFAAIAPTVAGLTPQQLTTVLSYHVLPAQVLAADIPFGTPVNTVANQTLTINAGAPPTVTDTTATPAQIVATDVRASNGVIHVIGKVLIPAL